MGNRFLALSLVALCILGLSSVSGKKTKKECKEPTHTAYELNYDWVMGQSAWYFPMLSKEELTRTSSDILKKTLKKIAEEDLSKACIQATWDGFSPVITGFSGKKTTYSLSPLDFTNFNKLGFDKAWKKGQSGTLFITHSDNKNFVFFVRCWEDGERTWMVMTTSKKPSEEVTTQIKNHVKELGFPEDDIEAIDYEVCAAQKTEL